MSVFSYHRKGIEPHQGYLLGGWCGVCGLVWCGVYSVCGVCMDARPNGKTSYMYT